MYKKTYIISLGGSLIVPAKGIDYDFLFKFHDFILERIKEGNKFFIITGGGRTARDYIKAASKVVKVDDEDSDWLGIHSTRLNGHLIRTIFRNLAYPKIIKNPKLKILANKSIIVAGGWRPGRSTDFMATLLAEKYKIKTIINLSNIDYVYDSDPKIKENAKKFEKISWENFRKIVGDKWDPGLSAPFDPVASKKCEKLGLEVVILNGNNFDNLGKYFKGRKFKGTIIS